MIFLKLFDYDQEKSKSKRGLNKGGAVQKFVDSEVIRHMDSYTPFKSGALKSSPQGQSTIGSGKITQQTPYAKRLYYNPQYNFNEAPRRGGKWFERMKQNHKSDILKGAAQISGAKI